EVAGALGLPVRRADPGDAAERRHLERLAPDALISAYWHRPPTDDVIALAPIAVNLHASLLPRYRGHASVNWQILHGEREGGISLHHMVAEADAGDLIDQEAVAIGDDDTPLDVYRRLVPAAARVLRRTTVPLLARTAASWPQLASKATVFGPRRGADGLIDFHYAATDVHNLIRASTAPEPGAFTHVSGRPLIVWRAQRDPALHAWPDPAGCVHAAPDGVYVVCGDRRRVRLTEVELDGRRGDPREFRQALGHGTILGPGASGAPAPADGPPRR
ncbi:formyltransferase family protein, partial [Streptomyces sp. SID3343]|uniref:methionyl-tRNA formyltransferase n=1 Tax=Streptomyces sp. SID3343 TaxID=2690260 RepID=UPI0013BF96F2